MDINLLEQIKFNDQGLIPAVLQDAETLEVLMVAYMNEESLRKTLETKKACFWSRSRQELWLKGETSGNYQYVKEIRIDCDNDTLLVLVEPAGPACHTGNNTCFYRQLTYFEETEKNTAVYAKFKEKAVFLKELSDLIQNRKVNPKENSYTSYLFREGIDKICKKVGEEAAEVIIGAKNADKAEIIYEVGDLIYHLLVLLNVYEIPFEDILTELENRHK